MKKGTHYTPTEEGFSINASSEIFNRTLYGSHTNDDREDRFFTFAGDAPQIMGAVADWQDALHTLYAKCGVLNSGLAITPGHRNKFYYSKDIDQTSKWFHNSEDISAEFKNGWMEYELSQISPWFPDVLIKMEAYPLLPDDGYLVHYKITSDQRVFFVGGFGGITDFLARFEYRAEPKRVFTAEDCKGNTVEIGENRGCITHTNGTTMRIGTSFSAQFSVGSATAMSGNEPSTFLGVEPENEDDKVIRISAVIEPGKEFEGYIVVVRNSDDETLDKWLTMENPVAYIKRQLYQKTACIDIKTPEKTLDLTVPPTVMALDASWHRDSFHHGAFAYHAPFLGWRNWYAPTALGWGDRVAKTMERYFKTVTKGDIKEEKVWYDDSPLKEGEYRFDRRYHNMENPVGRMASNFLPYTHEPVYGPYNMQECAFDMMLYYIEWTGDLAIAEKNYDVLCSMVEWETRMFDPDGDGLYQSMLNTWISDGHNYNGAGCAQSTAYNYRANLVMAKIAKRLGKDWAVFEERAEKIRKALNEKLWIAEEGVIAECLDTVGNCLIHPSTELPSVYHVIDSDAIDYFRAYRTLKYTENHIKNIVTSGSNGRLCFSSNWLPKQYSNCGIFTAENAHLALAYYKVGLKEKGKEILDGIVDCYFTGKNPATAAHIQSAKGTCDLGELDFTDVSSTYLRLVVEGLFGIRIDHLDNCIHIQPGFPDDWDSASLNLKDISLNYNRIGYQEIFNIHCERAEEKHIRIPMRSTQIDAVLLDGEPIDYEIVASPNNSFIMIKVEKVGRFQLRVMQSGEKLPAVCAPDTILDGNRVVFEVKNATVTDILDISQALDNIEIVGNKVYATAKAVTGYHTLFIRVKNGEYDSWLAADYQIAEQEKLEEPLLEKPFEMIDISKHFNCNMTEVHEHNYIHPRPQGYSMGMFQNGRYSHNWTQAGRHVVRIDDSMLRNSGGMVFSPSGIPFATPEENENLACVTVWDTFPTELKVDLDGKGQEIAVMFIASAFCLHSYVENARVTVTYADGTTNETKLVYPLNLDDWLTSALTTEAEIFYFSNYNHATVLRLRIDPEKELESIKIKAVANEVVIGVAGISISR